MAVWTPVDHGERAVVSMASAPFPHGDRPYGDPSVWIFVPTGAAQGDRVNVVVHYHGFESLLAETVPAYRLESQLVASGRDAVLVVPQGPVRMRDGDFGKLMEAGGLARMIDDVLGVLRHDGRSGGGGVGAVTLSVHSGGYRAAARALQHGGVAVDQVLLFDALYGELDQFEAFVAAGGRLKSVHTPKGGTRGANLRLRERLIASGVAVSDALNDPEARVIIGASEEGHNECLAEGGLANGLR